MWFTLIWPMLLTILVLIHRDRLAQKLPWLMFVIIWAPAITITPLVSLMNDTIQTSDTEILGGYATRCEHYEAWDERVSCRHPIYRTETYRDGQGKIQTREVLVGYQHPYDVDYHPEYWVMLTTLGKYNIEKSTYDRLIEKWGKPTFEDMRRNYHFIDGDMYHVEWDNNNDTIEPTFSAHTYENRTQIASTVFSFREINPKDTPVYEYTPINGWRINNILGPHSTQKISEEFEKLNAVIGPNNQCHIWICTWKNQPQSVGRDQQHYWKGGNKNELIITLSTDNNDKPQWAYVFSWMDNQEFSYRIRDMILTQNKLDLMTLKDYLAEEIPNRWERKQFSKNAPDKGYSYVNTDIPVWVVCLTHIAVISSTIFIFKMFQENYCV